MEGNVSDEEKIDLILPLDRTRPRSLSRLPLHLKIKQANDGGTLRPVSIMEQGVRIQIFLVLTSAGVGGFEVLQGEVKVWRGCQWNTF